MYWKYHIESGDAIVFDYEGKRAEGTVRGWINPEQYEDTDFEDVEPSDFELYVTSGQKDVTINLEDVEKRVAEDNRQTDLPLLSEEFRLTGGVEQV